MESRVEKAIHNYKYSGCNCTQAVVKTYASAVNVDEDLLFRISEGFDSGIPGYEGICGAASGMIMIAGLVYSDLDIEKNLKKLLIQKSWN